MLLASDDRLIGENICTALKASVHKRYHKRMDLMVEQIYNNESEFAAKNLITSEMLQAWGNIRLFQKTKNRNILFTATMSAGKSTLINSLVGQELAYAKKAACTSTVMEFLSAPVVHPCFNVLSDNQLYLNLEANKVRELTKGREKPCKVVGYFKSQLCRNKFTLIDTPGVNSSQSPAHKQIARAELLKNDADAIVYVIPVETYGSEDDYFHLQFIKQKVEYKKIFFIVNMMDTCDLEDDTVQEIIDNIVEHLSSIGFENPVVCPISAKAGLLLKRALTGYSLSENDEKACRVFISRFLNTELDLSKYFPEVREFEFDHDSEIKLQGIDNEKLKRAYIHTGLPGFERLLLEITEDK